MMPRHSLPPHPHARLVNRFIPSLLFEPDTGTSASGSASGGNDPAQAFQNALARSNNDAMALATRLFDENYQLRGRNRELQGQLPAQGTTLLNAEDGARWQAYQQLGHIDALTQQLQSAQDSATELASLKRGAHLQEVAAIAKMNATVLGTLLGDRELIIRGEASERQVIVKDGNTERPLAEFAKSTWSDFMPALLATTPPAGTPFVPQIGSTTHAPATSIDYLKQFQATRDAAASPLDVSTRK